MHTRLATWQHLHVEVHFELRGWRECASNVAYHLTVESESALHVHRGVLDLVSLDGELDGANLVECLLANATTESVDGAAHIPGWKVLRMEETSRCRCDDGEWVDGEVHLARLFSHLAADLRQRDGWKFGGGWNGEGHGRVAAVKGDAFGGSETQLVDAIAQFRSQTVEW